MTYDVNKFLLIASTLNKLYTANSYADLEHLLQDTVLSCDK